MKAHTLVALLCVSAFIASGQGMINFNNRVLGSNGVVAPVYGPGPSDFIFALRGNATTNGGTVDYTGHPLLMGTGYTAELWGGFSGNSLVPVARTTFRTSAAFAGFIQPPSLAPTVPGVPGGSSAVFQLRVWDNMGGTITTWSQVFGSRIAAGASDLTPPIPLTEPPLVPPNLVGLTSFAICCVPEPSLLAPGALALGVLLLRRKFSATPSRRP